MHTAPVAFSTFLRTFCAVLIIAIALVLGFVVIVDPYGLYGLVDRAGFNHIKPGLTRYQGQIKMAQALRRQRQLVIFGNSRAEIGLDPRAPVFGDRAGYNLAIPGTSVYTAIDQITELARAHAAPQTVIVGVEFLDFLVPARAAARAHAAVSTAVHRPWFWRFDTLFSLTSITDALRTLRIQRNPEASIMTPEGFNPLNEYLPIVRDEGYGKIFAQRAQESAATLRNRSTSDLETADFDALHRFLMAATAHPAEVKLVIYPYHAQMLALFESAGMWPLFEQWKRAVVGEVDAMRRLRPGVDITVVDFSGFGPYNCERVPDGAQRKGTTIWYWEAGHFKKALGDLMLRRLMTDAPAGDLDPAFGTTLDAASLARNSARIAAERVACVAAQPALFAAAAKMVARTR